MLSATPTHPRREREIHAVSPVIVQEQRPDADGGVHDVVVGQDCVVVVKRPQVRQCRQVWHTGEQDDGHQLGDDWYLRGAEMTAMHQQ